MIGTIKKNQGVTGLKKLQNLVLLICSLFVVLGLSGCLLEIDDGPHHRHHQRSSRRPRPKPHPRRSHFAVTLQDGPSVLQARSIDVSCPVRGGGNIRFTLSDGVVYQGTYTVDSWNEETSLFSKTDYREYWGETDPAAEAQCGRFTATSTDGAVIRGEYFPSSQDPRHGYGLLKDSHGNIYPLEL
jgi:hypothetical protein